MTLYFSQKIITTKLLLEKSDKNMEQAVYNADMGYWDLVANRWRTLHNLLINAALRTPGVLHNPKPFVPETEL